MNVQRNRPPRTAARVLSALVAGSAVGVGATAGAALLLYTGQGFLRTAAFLIGLSLAALAAGVWVGRAGNPRAGAGVRWIALVLAFAAAGGFAVLWTGREALQATSFGGALAVLLILAGPAYFAGSLLVALAARDGTAAAGIGGAAIGVLMAGALLIPNIDAPVVFLGVAVVLALVGAAHASLHPLPGGQAMDINGRVVLVTGVGHPGQAGFAIANRLLDAGARVVITARSSRVHEIAKQLGPEERVTGVVADLAEDASVAQLIDAVHARHGRLDALINVAGGLTVIASVEDTTPDKWDGELRRNAGTAFRTSRAALPLLRESKGAIVNFAAPQAEHAKKNLAAYSAAKAAVMALTRALAIEERDRGVRVNAIAPGMIDTETNRADVEDPDAVRWVSREQIADVVLFLVSDAGAGVNGELVHVLAKGVS